MQEQYSQETLDKIKEYAGYLLTLEEISILIDVELDDLRATIQDKTNEASKAYYQGKTMTALAIRRQEVELAKVGSPMAVEHSVKFLTNMEISENG